jgi:predicted Fe-Mo cluster-binding NifX family protein
MKIAFTASGDSLDAPLDSRFGRASCFLIYDDTTGRLEALENEQNLNAVQGAGIQAAAQMVRHDVDCVITGHCGPKAFQVLESAGIKVYPCTAETVADAYQLLKDGGLVATESATVEGHW